MKKKIVSLLLTLCLLVTLLPVPALAAGAVSGGIFDVSFGRGMVLDCQRMVFAHTGAAGYEISANSFGLPYSAAQNWETDLGTDYLKLESVGVRSDMGDTDAGKALDTLISGAGSDTPVFKLVRYTKDGALIGDFSNVGYAVYCGDGLCLFSAIEGGAAYNSYGYLLQTKIEYGEGLKDSYSGSTDKTLAESLADMEALAGLKPLVINQGTREEITLYLSDGDTAGSVKAQLRAKSILPCDLTLSSGGQELADDAVISSGADITAVFDSYAISTPGELKRFRDAVNGGTAFEGKTVTLTADIDLDGSAGDPWTPIGDYYNPFAGVFDGQGHTVSGLHFDDAGAKYAGLFGCIRSVGASILGGAIQNVGVTDSYIRGRECVGGVCGESYGLIQNCWNDSQVMGEGMCVGGVCGFNKGTVSLCRNTGAVSGEDRVGGVCGYMGEDTSKIENCMNTGTVSGNTMVGGVCGFHEDGLLTSSCSIGQVSGSSDTGGVFGRQELLYDPQIENCYFNSDTCGAGGTGEGVTGMTAAEFAGGEAAYLLQGAGEAQVWGQSLGGDSADPLPVLTDDAAKRVYQVTFKIQSDGAEDDYAVVYANPSGVGADRMPEAPVSGTKTFANWSVGSAGGGKFTAGTAVTQDMTVYAQWRSDSGEGGSASTPSDGPDDPAVWENPFTDVQAGAWYEDAVRFTVENGLFYGTSDTTFSPNGTMSRGMLATVLYRLAKEPGAAAEGLFHDVADGRYYTEAVDWAAENRIVTGYGNGNYGPDDPITREQLAAILWRYAQKTGNDGIQNGTEILRFPDTGDVADWAKEAMTWTVDWEIIRGKGGILDPKGSATRAQVAVMLMRFCEKAK